MDALHRVLRDGTRSAGKGAFDPLAELCRGQRAADAGNFASITEHGQRGNAPDAKALRQPALVLGIYLCEHRVSGKFACNAGEGRRKGTAGPAPRRPEIHDHCRICRFGEFSESRFVEGDRCTGQQGGFAASAHRAIGGSVGRNPIPLSAGGAFKKHGVVSFPISGVEQFTYLYNIDRQYTSQYNVFPY